MGGKKPWGDGQLDLFEPRDAPRGPDPSVARLAARLPQHVRFGTSSWTFPGWAGLVYHRRYRDKAAFLHDSLEEYARYPLFRTVGIDRSFYAPLRQDELVHYARQLPADFRCAMKVWREVTTRVFTHGDRAGRPNPRFLDPGLFAEAVWAPVRDHFAAHLGPLLVEIPPAPGAVNLDGFLARLEGFLTAAPPGAELSFELRDERLLVPAYFDLLRAHGAVHVYNYWTKMPPLAVQRALSGPLWGTLVVRLMIPPGRRYADLRRRYESFDRLVAPQPQMREQTVALIREAEELGHEAFVLVNNKAEGSSPLTVQALARML